MSQLEDDIYDDLYGDSTDLKSTTSQTPSPTEEKQEQPAPTASPARETNSVGTGENSLPAKPAPSTELSYSAQIAQQFSAYKQTPAQERQSQAHLAVSRSVGGGSDAVVLPQSPSQDESVARSRPVRPSEMKDEG
ncbi:hypothetical protein WOLCODRAFT_25700 [Wolfiporia cocos MD-104 SS10]|uniref:Uncharacterized protein n=1 Tax=Wolfiporia cocos (strain MD-104) TaxID=742152 RepID=A0A2H3JYU7_WOLCO|nr:hypothetical protein WOLCODRAFT_25700 [Wolfiporia cocos MD-104 SS10]